MRRAGTRRVGPAALLALCAAALLAAGVAGAPLPPPPRAARGLLAAGAADAAGSGLGLGGGGPRRGHGAYLGCFDAAKLGLSFGRSVGLTPETAFRCADHCRGLRMPMYALSRALRCACTARVPAPSARAPPGACEALPAGAAGPALLAAVPVFYVTPDTQTGCRVDAPPLDGDGLTPAFNPENALFDSAAGALTLRLRGGQGVRVAGGGAQRYGMYSFRARASAAPGVITAAYVSGGWGWGRGRGEGGALVCGRSAAFFCLAAGCLGVGRPRPSGRQRAAAVAAAGGLPAADCPPCLPRPVPRAPQLRSDRHEGQDRSHDEIGGRPAGG
jgi:hypothetical protein